MGEWTISYGQIVSQRKGQEKFAASWVCMPWNSNGWYSFVIPMASITEAEVSISVCVLEFKFVSSFMVMTRIPKMWPHHLSLVSQAARYVCCLAKPGLSILLLHYCKAGLFSGLVFGTTAHSQLLGGLLLAGRVGVIDQLDLLTLHHHQQDLKRLGLKNMTDFNENTLLLGETRDGEGVGKSRGRGTCVPTAPSEGSHSHQERF